MSRHTPIDRVEPRVCEQSMSACPLAEPARGRAAVLDSSGASSLQAAAALKVSGTVGTTLTTKTTGAGHKTTFGATTVGTSLNVTSTGAVTSTSSGILTVDGAGTTTPTSQVTVNGTVGAVIQ